MWFQKFYNSDSTQRQSTSDTRYLVLCEHEAWPRDKSASSLTGSRIARQLPAIGDPMTWNSVILA
jgi:hypothetical protein